MQVFLWKVRLDEPIEINVSYNDAKVLKEILEKENTPFSLQLAKQISNVLNDPYFD